MLNTMDLRSLEYFLAVADEESFTRAAARCRVTQPSISAQIQALERELGESLFERLPRGTSLSVGGQVLLPYARQCLAAAAAAKSEFSARAGLLQGEFRLGTVSGIERTLVPELLGTFHEQFPGVDVTVTEGTSAPLLDLVNHGGLDTAVIARPMSPLPPTLSAATLLADELLAVFNPEVFAIDSRPVPVSALHGLSIISYAPSSGLRSIMDAAFAAAGLALHVNHAANDVRLQLALAQQGVGVAISAGSDPALADVTGLSKCSLDPAIGYEKVLIWRNDSTPRAPLRAFLRLWTELRARTESQR